MQMKFPKDMASEDTVKSLNNVTEATHTFTLLTPSFFKIIKKELKS